MPQRTSWSALVAIGAIGAAVLGVPARASARISAYPSPGTRVASPRTRLNFRGVAPAALGTISVSGSVTGAHSGHVEAHSDGDGASFVPDKPFAQGERVTVRTDLDVAGGRHGAYAIRIAHQGRPLRPPARQPPLLLHGRGVLRPHSRHDLAIPQVTASAPHGRAPAGDLFLSEFDSPGQAGPGQHGPLVVGGDGTPIWFHPLPTGQTATDVRVQQYDGQPVMTWWQGFVNAGVGNGVGEVFDRSYRRIATIRAGDGYAADPHELQLTSRGTALVTSENPVVWDTSGIGGARRAVVLDSVVQEVEVKTGLVRFEWHSLDHVPVRESHVPPHKVDGHVDDYFHVNSASETPDGNLLVSSRNTWTIYKVARADGHVQWRLGGKRSSFSLGRGVSFAWQHDARVAGNGTITLFDDGAAPAVHSASRAIAVGLDTKRHRAWLVHDYRHRGPSLLANSQGSYQDLPGGDVLVGWGSERYETVYARHGARVRDYRFPAGDESYRAYLMPWQPDPLTRPALAASSAHGRTRVYASWNGADGVVRWRVLAGTDASTLKPVASVRRSGFETATTIAAAPVVAVQALGARGTVLATSAALAPKGA